MKPVATFVRCRPSGRKEKYSPISVDAENYSVVIRYERPHTFTYDRVFGADSTQEDIFNLIGKPHIEGLFSGMNGTIFAYGQTGSGKTFTITGGLGAYSQRGLIPRILSHLFLPRDDVNDCKLSVSISYMEIYNEVCYDLLTQRSSGHTELLKVVPMEDDGGNIQLRGLSAHNVQNEADALNLLFMGDTNRVVAETAMNNCSTRSHCIFMIDLEARRAETHTVRRSKLCLVDLAGSERLGKTATDSLVFSEGKSINLSLHFLEQVIVALNEKAAGDRNHVPYRNSVLTSVLRDSFGGNCNTSMIATISPDESSQSESLCTCRFAKRVGLIQNAAVVNEELDPQSIIERLTDDVRRLKEEVSLLNGGNPDAPLTSEECTILRGRVIAFLESRTPDDTLVCGSIAKIRMAFALMRETYKSVIEDRDRAVPSLQDKVRHYLVFSMTRPQFGAIENRPTLSCVQDGILESHPGQLRANHPLQGGPELQNAITSVTGLDVPTALCDTSAARKVYDFLYPALVSGIEDDKTRLKSLCEQGQSLGMTANEARAEICKLKESLDLLQESASSGELSRDSVAGLVKRVEEERRKYDHAISALRVTKDEMMRMKTHIRENRTRVNDLFSAWLSDSRERFGIH